MTAFWRAIGGGLVALIGKALTALFVFKAGVDHAERRNAEGAVEIQRRQMDVAADRPRDRGDLGRRLRDGTF